MAEKRNPSPGLAPARHNALYDEIMAAYARVEANRYDPLGPNEVTAYDFRPDGRPLPRNRAARILNTLVAEGLMTRQERHIRGLAKKRMVYKWVKKS